MENKWKNKNFKEALKNSLNGIKYTFINGKNFKIQLVIAIIAILRAIIPYPRCWQITIIACGCVQTKTRNAKKMNKK